MTALFGPIPLWLAALGRPRSWWTTICKSPSIVQNQHAAEHSSGETNLTASKGLLETSLIRIVDLARPYCTESLRFSGRIFPLCSISYVFPSGVRPVKGINSADFVNARDTIITEHKVASVFRLPLFISSRGTFHVGSWRTYMPSAKVNDSTRFDIPFNMASKKFRCLYSARSIRLSRAIFISSTFG